MRKKLEPVILYESWSEDPEDKEYLCERVFSESPFGTKGTEWATVYEMLVNESYDGLYSEEIGSIFYIRACSPGFRESDIRFKGKWRVESETFDDKNIKLMIADYVKSIKGFPLIKDPIEVLLASVYCENL